MAAAAQQRIAAFVFAFFAGAVGMLASTIGKKTLSCIIIAYVIYFAFHQLSTIPSVLIGVFAASGAEWVISLLMIFNPVVAVIDMFVLMFSGEGIFDNVFGSFGGWIWVILSGVVIMGISFVMLEIAAHRIDPLHGYTISRKQQNKMTTQYAQSPVNAAAPAFAAQPVVQSAAPEQVQNASEEEPELDFLKEKTDTAPATEPEITTAGGEETAGEKKEE